MMSNDVSGSNDSSADAAVASSSSSPPNVADAEFDQTIRIAALYVIVILGAVGGLLVGLWLWTNRKRGSRVNKIITHVVVSDLLVIFWACLPQLIWEYDRQWRAGVVFCKVLKYTTSFAMMASNYMLVLLSVDRYIAIMHPLRAPPTVSTVSVKSLVTITDINA